MSIQNFWIFLLTSNFKDWYYSADIYPLCSEEALIWFSPNLPLNALRFVKEHLLNLILPWCESFESYSWKNDTLFSHNIYITLLFLLVYNRCHFTWCTSLLNEIYINMWFCVLVGLPEPNGYIYVEANGGLNQQRTSVFSSHQFLAVTVTKKLHCKVFNVQWVVHRYFLLFCRYAMQSQLLVFWTQLLLSQISTITAFGGILGLFLSDMLDIYCDP